MTNDRKAAKGRRITRMFLALAAAAGLALLLGGATRKAPTASDVRDHRPLEASHDLVEPARWDATTSDSEAEADFASGQAAFAVAFRDIVTPYRTFLMTASPGERVRLRAIRVDPPAAGASTTPNRFAAVASAGEIARAGPVAWEWTAPAAPGHYRVQVTDQTTGERVTLSAAVLVPMSRLQRGAVSGYRVGTFPGTPYRGLPQYERPAGLLVLRPEHATIPVSPHFTLGQFPAKGPPGWPKYLVLSERLLLKLEMLLEETNRRGIPAPTFQVLSGFRSPWYNGSIGRPKYSRHIYGDAADIYVDVDRDGRMDDLNRDGHVDLRDAGLLYDIVEEMDGAEETSHLLGGLGKYPTTSTHGPFVHVDTRLYRARW